MSRSKRNWSIIADLNPKSPISEAYRTLRTNIDFSGVDHPLSTIMVTSSGVAEGKSTTSSNLAVVYAQSEKRVLLMDADLRKPALHHIFMKSNRTGLTSCLTGQCELEEAVQKTNDDYLSILTAGPIPPNPSEMLSSRKMRTFLETVKSRYDVVIVDTPPVTVVTDAQIVSAMCDGVVLVVDAGKVTKQAAAKSKESLSRANARILGVVLNNVNRKQSEGYAYYHYYGN